MKFPRNARVFRGNFDVVPYMAVLFLLAMFLMLGSLVSTPGVRLDIPRADDFAGTDKPSEHVAVDSIGRLYYKNQLIEQAKLQSQLRARVEASPEPLSLVVHADKSVQYEKFMHLVLLAREVGIQDVLLAVLPRMAADADGMNVSEGQPPSVSGR
jgi:biopolymer transport protein ExbD